MLFSLPGRFEPNAALRQCVAKLLRDYLTSINPMKCLNEFKEQNKDKAQSYPDDLEMDYLMFLKKVQKATKENPLDVEFDFP